MTFDLVQWLHIESQLITLYQEYITQSFQVKIFYSNFKSKCIYTLNLHQNTVEIKISQSKCNIYWSLTTKHIYYIF